MSVGKSHKERKCGMYSAWGSVPLDNCVTAVTENLVVNIGPLSGASSKKKSVEREDSDGFPTRALVGTAHLDTFLIHEVSTEPGKEFQSKSIHTIHLPAALQNRCIILRAKWISLPKPICVKLLVLCSNYGVYFYNESGSKQVYKFDYDGEDSDLTRCCRAIASTRANILLGNERGELYLFSYDPRKGAVMPSKVVKLLSEPVAEMCARKNGLLVVGSPTGAVSVWTLFQGEAKKSTEYILSKPETVTSIQLWYPYALVSYGSGLLRMYNLVERVLTAQVSAHSRWISTMDLCPSANLLITLAEDDQARIWSLSRRQKEEQRLPIRLLSTIQIDDMNLIGGKFLNVTGTALGICNLGSKEIAVYAAHHHEEHVKR